MTSTLRAGRSTSSTTWLFAIGGAAASMALTAYGSFKEELQPGDVPGWLFINVPIIVVATALVFGLVLPRVLRSDDPEAPARAALVFSLLGLASVLVANFGFPAVFASAALCTATATRRRTGRWTGVGGVALVLSVLAVAGAAFFAIAG